MRIEQRLIESVARYGAQPAVVAQRASYSYAELDLRSERLAAALQEGGVGQGAPVAIFMDDGWEAVVSLFAALKAGAVVVPIDVHTSASDLGEILQRHQPVAIVTQARLAAMVAAAIAPLRSVRLCVLAGGDRARAGDTCISFEETVGRIGRPTLLPPAGADTDPAVLFGEEAPLSHRDVIADAAALGDLDNGSILLPLATRGGLSWLLAAMAAGRGVVVQSLFDRGGRERIAAAPRREPAIGLSTLLDGAIAGGMPAYQR